MEDLWFSIDYKKKLQRREHVRKNYLSIYIYLSASVRKVMLQQGLSYLELA